MDDLTRLLLALLYELVGEGLVVVAADLVLVRARRLLLLLLLVVLGRATYE